MITAAQLRAARALLGIDQRKLAELSGLSLPTIQRMEASGDVMRGNIDSLMKLVSALDAAGIAIRELGPVVPPLEAAFLSLTGADIGATTVDQEPAR